MSKIVILSTWGIRCGIAGYSSYLISAINKILPESTFIHKMNSRDSKYKIEGDVGIVHIEHEFGIWPYHWPNISSKCKVIVTFHTISDSEKMKHTMKGFEKHYNVSGYIVHNEVARSNLSTSKNIWTIPHGSTIIPEMDRKEARRRIGLGELGDGKKIGFVFGFQSGDKHYERLINTARKVGIYLLVSGAPRDDVKIDKSIFKGNNSGTIFIKKYLNEEEVNLYSLASDILLFDYSAKEHYSVSGAMHRIIGSGRPVICSDIRHFGDIENEVSCLKFKDDKGLERCLRKVLDDTNERERLEREARKYAESTSWEKVAQKHINLYRRYIDL
jgi:glycosyltransferase involved in cell wall biosynthesis